MNRRKFLGRIGVATAVASTPALAAKAIEPSHIVDVSKKVAKLTSLTPNGREVMRIGSDGRTAFVQ